MSSEQISRDLGQQEGQGEGVGTLRAIHNQLAKERCMFAPNGVEPVQTIDWQSIATVMDEPAWLFDARAVADADAARAAGLQVWCVGKG